MGHVHPKSFILKLRCFCNSHSTLNRFLPQLEESFSPFTGPFRIPPSTFYCGIWIAETTKYLILTFHFLLFACHLPHFVANSRYWKTQNVLLLSFVFQFLPFAADSGVQKSQNAYLYPLASLFPLSAFRCGFQGAKNQSFCLIYFSIFRSTPPTFHILRRILGHGNT